MKQTGNRNLDNLDSKSNDQYYFIPIRMSTIKKQKQQKISAGKDVGKLEHSCFTGGNIR